MDRLRHWDRADAFDDASAWPAGCAILAVALLPVGTRLINSSGEIDGRGIGIASARPVLRRRRRVQETADSSMANQAEVSGPFQIALS